MYKTGAGGTTGAAAWAPRWSNRPPQVKAAEREKTEGACSHWTGRNEVSELRLGMGRGMGRRSGSCQGRAHAHGAPQARSSSAFGRRRCSSRLALGRRKAAKRAGERRGWSVVLIIWSDELSALVGHRERLACIHWRGGGKGARIPARCASRIRPTHSDCNVIRRDRTEGADHMLADET